MIDFSVHNWKDALAAIFFVVVLPAFFILIFASALMEDFKRQGNWSEIRRDIWKFNPDTFGECLYGIGFGAILLSFMFATRMGLPLAIGCAVLSVFGLAAVVTLVGRLFLTLIVWQLERKHPNRKP